MRSSVSPELAAIPQALQELIGAAVALLDEMTSVDVSAVRIRADAISQLLAIVTAGSSVDCPQTQPAGKASRLDGDLVKAALAVPVATEEHRELRPTERGFATARRIGEALQRLEERHVTAELILALSASLTEAERMLTCRRTPLRERGGARPAATRRSGLRSSLN